MRAIFFNGYLILPFFVYRLKLAPLDRSDPRIIINDLSCVYTNNVKQPRFLIIVWPVRVFGEVGIYAKCFVKDTPV